MIAFSSIHYFNGEKPFFLKHEERTSVNTSRLAEPLQTKYFNARVSQVERMEGQCVRSNCFLFDVTLLRTSLSRKSFSKFEHRSDTLSYKYAMLQNLLLQP